MDMDADVLEVIEQDRAVVVVRAGSVADPVALTKLCVEAGIRCIEFTFSIANAPEVIRAATKAGAGALVGAGTVMRTAQARAAIEAGARFLVSPVCKPELLGSVPTFLGGFSPTEIVAAAEAGAAAVKLFPAGIGGPSYLRELRGPFPELSLLPSGGVDVSNARAYLDAGATAVYAGSSVAPASAVASGDHVEIARRLDEFAAALDR
jgi:2-dehydro-3-deoxyphosphogluconate aldolase / (4S)-4-hydroxy-2-oxoglutarate aldolase